MFTHSTNTDNGIEIITIIENKPAGVREVVKIEAGYVYYLLDGYDFSYLQELNAYINKFIS